MDETKLIEEKDLYECVYCKKRFKTIEEQKQILLEGRSHGKMRRTDFENSCYYWLLLCDNAKCRNIHKKTVK